MGLWFHDPDGYRWELACLVESNSACPSRCGAVGTLLCAAHSKVPALSAIPEGFSFFNDKMITPVSEEGNGKGVRPHTRRVLAADAPGTLE